MASTSQVVFEFCMHSMNLYVLLHSSEGQAFKSDKAQRTFLASCEGIYFEGSVCMHMVDLCVFVSGSQGHRL